MSIPVLGYTLEQYRDPDWLHTHLYTLHEEITSALSHSETRQDAIQHLLAVLPLLLNHHDLKTWGTTIDAAVNKPSIQISEGSGQRLIYTISPYFLHSKEKKLPQPTKKRRSRTRFRGSDLFAVYLTLLMDGFYHAPDNTIRDQIKDILDFARRVNNFCIYMRGVHNSPPIRKFCS